MAKPPSSSGVVHNNAAVVEFVASADKSVGAPGTAILNHHYELLVNPVIAEVTPNVSAPERPLGFFLP